MSLPDPTPVEALLAQYIAFPTVSSDSNLDLAHLLANQMEAAGARVWTQTDPTGQKANVFATLGPEDTEGGLVLSGHMDVVPVEGQDWTSDPFQMVERDGRLYGRGTCDMKGFVAAAVDLAGRVDATLLRKPLHFAFTYDEEVGCAGAKALVERLRGQGMHPAMALIGEPTLMKIIEGHKGCCEVHVDITGKAGHSSRPELGVNAVEYAMALATHLYGLRDTMRARAPDDSPFTPPWTTMNVGRFEGGTIFNVIPERAQLDWEMRPIAPEDRDFIMDSLQTHIDEVLLPAMRSVDPTASIRMHIAGDVDALMPQRDNVLRDKVAAMTGQNDTDVVAFGTEAGLFQSLETDVIVCGPGSIDQAHQPDEFIARSELAKCMQLLDKLVADLSAA